MKRNTYAEDMMEYRATSCQNYCGSQADMDEGTFKGYCEECAGDRAEAQILAAELRAEAEWEEANES